MVALAKIKSQTVDDKAKNFIKNGIKGRIQKAYKKKYGVSNIDEIINLLIEQERTEMLRRIIPFYFDEFLKEMIQGDYLTFINMMIIKLEPYSENILYATTCAIPLEHLSRGEDFYYINKKDFEFNIFFSNPGPLKKRQGKIKISY